MQKCWKVHFSCIRTIYFSFVFLGMIEIFNQNQIEVKLSQDCLLSFNFKNNFISIYHPKSFWLRKQLNKSLWGVGRMVGRMRVSYYACSQAHTTTTTTITATTTHWRLILMITYWRLILKITHWRLILHYVNIQQ